LSVGGPRETDIGLSGVCKPLLLCCSEDGMKKAGVAHSKSSNDKESHVFCIYLCVHGFGL
uniref:Uncharacterized protein n=1 Tax=Theropithecus gelada TaxID=9565 RepID=A0A8D2JXF3_THEGE